MRTCIIISLMISCAFSAKAAEKEKRVSAVIDQVTIFYSGAQIERSSGSIMMEKGQTVLAFTGLEQHLMENSIRVGLSGEGKILSVVRRIDYLQEPEAGEKMAQLEERHLAIEREKEEVLLSSRVYEQEKNLLLTNINLGSEQQGVQISALKEAADFYRIRLDQIEKQLLANSRKIKALEEEAVKIRRQMNELNYQKNKPSSTMEVTVEMAAGGQIKILMDYYVPGARWTPLYDIRVDEVGKPVSVIRKATVIQSTGTDWENVRLIFSTGNPQDRASKPELDPWYLREVYPEPIVTYQENVRSEAPQAARKSVAAETAYAEEEADLGLTMEGAMPEVQAGARNSLLEFRLTSPSSVPSDNKEYTVLIGSMNLEALYEYHTVPKLDPSAYLIALIPDWDNYDLIDGSANIYYTGMFVGKTFLNASATLDTMQISLGKDKQIMVERKQIGEFTSDRLIGPNRKKEFGFENIIRNSKEITVTVTVEDQYPISTLKEVEVVQEDQGKARVDRVSGKVTWKQVISAGETVRLPLKYSVKYPSDKQINL